MGVANPPVDPANVMQALVYSLLDVFDATRDLYQTLTNKEQRDYEQNLRIKGYPVSRRIEYVKDERLGSDETIGMDRSTVTRQFEIGYQALGVEYAVGDVTSHMALQSQIITLQSVLVTTFLYGPTSPDPIAHQLSNIYAASRVAAASSVEVLAALQERLQDERPLTPRSMHSITARSNPTHAPSIAPSQSISQAPSQHTTSHAPTHHTSYVPTHAPSYAASHSRSRARSQTLSHAPTYVSHHKTSHAPSHSPSYHTSHAPSRALTLPPTATGTKSASTALMKYDAPRTSHMRSSSPVNTTILDWRDRTATDITSMTGPTSTSMQSASDDLYCSYAVDLQRDGTKSLSACITSNPSPYCPHCKGDLHMSPGKAWEISKWDNDCERTFQVQNRFVVKCHRDGPDGQYCCVICTKYADADTVCGDVKALVKHLSDEHDLRELKHEEDIVEVIEQPVSRRDSGIGYGSARGSRRSASLASSRRRKSLPGYEREVDIFEVGRSRR